MIAMRRAPLLRRFRGGGARLRRLTAPDAGRSTQAVRLDWIAARLDRRAPVVAGAVALACGTVGWLAAGPVAAGLAAVYSATAITLVVRRRRERAHNESAAAALDAFVHLAARLRAGADAVAVTSEALLTIRSCGAAGAQLAERVAAACRVAEITGARLADLLERIEEDARMVARVKAIATAQAAGAQATAWLLAALPFGGIALGFGIGADPLQVLLATRVGALCAGLAVLLQLAGLAWTRRLAQATRDAV
jgi:tight adherence protein B